MVGPVVPLADGISSPCRHMRDCRRHCFANTRTFGTRCRRAAEQVCIDNVVRCADVFAASESVGNNSHASGARAVGGCGVVRLVMAEPRLAFAYRFPNSPNWRAGIGHQSRTATVRLVFVFAARFSASRGSADSGYGAGAFKSALGGRAVRDRKTEYTTIRA